MTQSLQTSLRVSLLTGSTSFIWLIALYLLQLHSPDSSGAIRGLFNLVILAVGIHLSIVETSVKSKTSTFKDYMVTGILVTLFVSVLTFLGRYFYFAFVNKDFGLELAGSPASRYQPAELALISFLVMGAAGLVFSVISAKMTQILTSKKHRK